MNWGYRILIVYISFVLMISFLIYLCTSQRIDLVSSNYYDQEIKYQQQVNRMNNVIADHNKVEVSYDDAAEIAEFRFAEGGAPSGKIQFFKPDNADEDFTSTISVNEKNYQSVDAAKFKKGKWYVKISWTANAKDYYQQEALYIK